MMNLITWTEKEIEFLKENYSKLGRRACSEKLNRSIKDIQHGVRKFKLKYKIPIGNDLIKYGIFKEGNMWIGYFPCPSCNINRKYTATERYYVLRNIKKSEKQNILCDICCRTGEKKSLFWKNTFKRINISNFKIKNWKRLWRK